MLRIAFMGTPHFAVPSLQALANSQVVQVVGVVTTPDKPAGRGQAFTQSPVKQAALQLGLSVLQPEKLREPGFQATLQAWELDLLLVVAFRMLPQSVWAMPRLGTINLHASLLPAYRGAAPIHWAVMNGEVRTGLTTFFIEQDIDTGKLLLQQELPIGPNDTTGQLHDRMMHLGAELLLKTVAGLANGSLQAVPQNPALALHAAPKLFKQDTAINWQQPSKVLHNFIRGLSPHPGAYTSWQGKAVKIYLAALVPDGPTPATPGTVVNLGGQLLVAAADGWLRLAELQLEGRRRLSGQEFLLGAHGLTAFDSQPTV